MVRGWIGATSPGCVSGVGLIRDLSVPLIKHVVKDDTVRSSDVDAVFVAEHRYLHDGVALGQAFGVDAVDFVTEDDGGGLGPVEGGVGHRVVRDFDADDGDVLFVERVKAVAGPFMVRPGDVFEGTEGGFLKFFVRGMGGHATQVDMGDGPRVGSAKNGSDVERAADIVEYHVDRVSGNWREVVERNVGIMGFDVGHLRVLSGHS